MKSKNVQISKYGRFRQNTFINIKVTNIWKWKIPLFFDKQRKIFGVKIGSEI